MFDRLTDCLPKSPCFEYDWPGVAALSPLKPWFLRMEETPQNPLWHGEGNVWIHTKRVCEALTGLSDFRTMPPRARNALALAALLHDIGKVTTTRLEGGEWVSPRHGPAGAKIARKLLWQDFELCGDAEKQKFREAVCLLIRYHTRPVHLLEGDNASNAMLRLAANGELAPGFTLRALCLLAEADVLGRIAPDNPELLEGIELARELAGEEGCLDGPYPFRSARTQRLLFEGGSLWKDQVLYDDTWGEVILMCGLPGTGKDTWIGATHPDLPVVSLDGLRLELNVDPADRQGPVVRMARERARQLLRARRPFIWNATSLTSLRRNQLDLFHRYRARVRIVYLETPWSENLRRNADRRDAVPLNVLDHMLSRLEPPERFEAQRVDWLCL